MPDPVRWVARQARPGETARGSISLPTERALDAGRARRARGLGVFRSPGEHIPVGRELPEVSRRRTLSRITRRRRHSNTRTCRLANPHTQYSTLYCSVLSVANPAPCTASSSSAYRNLDLTGIDSHTGRTARANRINGLSPPIPSARQVSGPDWPRTGRPGNPSGGATRARRGRARTRDLETAVVHHPPPPPAALPRLQKWGQRQVGPHHAPPTPRAACPSRPPSPGRGFWRRREGRAGSDVRAAGNERCARHVPPTGRGCRFNPPLRSETRRNVDAALDPSRKW
jgi:hypothetical protein